MDESEIYGPDFKRLIAFLVKLGQQSLMDHGPLRILAEVDLVDTERENYLATLDEDQKRRYNAYIEFYKLNIERDITMSDENVDQQAAPTPEAPAAPAAEEPKAE